MFHISRTSDKKHIQENGERRATRVNFEKSRVTTSFSRYSVNSVCLESAQRVALCRAYDPVNCPRTLKHPALAPLLPTDEHAPLEVYTVALSRPSLELAVSAILIEKLLAGRRGERGIGAESGIVAPEPPPEVSACIFARREILCCRVRRGGRDGALFLCFFSFFSRIFRGIWRRKGGSIEGKREGRFRGKFLYASSI